jgi:hypothetical protein
MCSELTTELKGRKFGRDIAALLLPAMGEFRPGFFGTAQIFLPRPGIRLKVSGA